MGKGAGEMSEEKEKKIRRTKNGLPIPHLINGKQVHCDCGGRVRKRRHRVVVLAGIDKKYKGEVCRECLVPPTILDENRKLIKEESTHYTLLQNQGR